MSNLYNDFRSSLLAFCGTFKDTNMSSATVIDFETHGDESTLPATDCVGISQFTIGVDEGFVEIEVLIGLATLDDESLFRLREKMGTLFEQLLPTKRIKVVDADTGAEKGFMVVENGTKVLPVSGSAARPLQFVMVRLLSSLTFQL